MYLAKVRRDIVYLDEAATSEYKIVIFFEKFTYVSFTVLPYFLAESPVILVSTLFFGPQRKS